MYIDPFIAGALSTFFVELVILMIAAFIKSIGGKK